jgi:AhpD family alkylhydroperoxidase
VSDVATTRSLASDPKVSELVALGAAVGSGCEACFRSHFETARTVGVTDDEIHQAVTVARAVRETSAARVLDLAARKLELSSSAFATQADVPAADSGPDPTGGDCC